MLAVVGTVDRRTRMSPLELGAIMAALHDSWTCAFRTTTGCPKTPAENGHQEASVSAVPMMPA